MKTFFNVIVLSMISFTSMSQDCAKYIETTTDEMTDKTFTSSKRNIIVSDDGGKSGFGIFFMITTNGTLVMDITVKGARGCFDDAAILNVLYVDGTKREVITDTKFNCKGDVIVYFDSHNEFLDELKTKKIKAIRATSRDGFVQKDFSIDNQSELLAVINCLSK